MPSNEPHPGVLHVVFCILRLLDLARLDYFCSFILAFFYGNSALGCPKTQHVFLNLSPPPALIDKFGALFIGIGFLCLMNRPL